MADRKLPLLGRLAVHHKLVTVEQVIECMAEQRTGAGSPPIGEILVQKGYLSPQRLQQLLEAQKRMLDRHRGSGRAPLRAAPTPAVEPDAAAASSPAASTPVASEGPPRSRDVSALDQMLRDAVAKGASDVHLHSGVPLQLRVAGSLSPLDGGPLDPERARKLLMPALSDEQCARLESAGQVDLCHAMDGLGRFRVNVYRQQAGLDAVLRFVPPQPPSLAELGLPPELAKLTEHRQGMVLVTGPSGCGKTSTLAAMVDLINGDRAEHILSIEDPIEYVHTSKSCLVNQRSVGPHTGSFARALRAALREDPDVIVIGELRDLETISLALTAAETGHFVLATLHTGGAIRTLNRLIGSFPANQQSQVRTMLSESIKAVVSQRLVPKADGSGRAPAVETLVVTKAVGNLIRENKTFQIQSILQTGSRQGMCTLDQSLTRLVSEGVVTREEAQRHCDDPKALAA